MVRKLFRIVVSAVTIIMLAMSLCACGDLASQNTAVIDWEMDAMLLNADGSLVSECRISLSGAMSGKDEENRELELHIQFPETFQYRINNPDEAGYTYLAGASDNGYYWLSGYSYDTGSNAAVRTEFAISPDREYAVFYFDDSTGRFLAASTDTNVDSDTILAYFHEFYEHYSSG